MVSSRRPTKWRARSTTSRCLTPRSSGSTLAIQHYEISRYGTLIVWAQELGHDNVVALLNANLKEEKVAGKKLSGPRLTSIAGPRGAAPPPTALPP